MFFFLQRISSTWFMDGQKFKDRLIDIFLLNCSITTQFCSMVSSVKGQGEPDPVLWGGKMALSCLLRFTCCVPQETKCSFSIYQIHYIWHYLLVWSRWLQCRCSSCSFCVRVCLWTLTPSQSKNTQSTELHILGQYLAILISCLVNTITHMCYLPTEYPRHLSVSVSSWRS